MLVHSARGPVVTLPAPQPGQYVVALDVWDVAGGYASASVPLSVDASNVLDWRSGATGFAAPVSPGPPRPAASIALNGNATGELTIRAQASTGTLVEIDGGASTDGRGNRLAYSWTVEQLEPVTQSLALMLGYTQPAHFTHMCV